MATTPQPPAAKTPVKKVAERKLKQTKVYGDLIAKYGPMSEAATQMYPHAPNHLLLAVLICAGANPLWVPRDEPYDEGGYYQMDWQLGTRSKYPWPSTQLYLDALNAEEWGIRGTVRD